MQKYRLPIGILMALLIANAVLWKDLHQLFLHQHEPLHCEVDDSQTHIHGEDYLAASCLVCCFQFSAGEEIIYDLPFVKSPLASAIIHPVHFVYLIGTENDNTPLRGPPAFLS